MRDDSENHRRSESVRPGGSVLPPSGESVKVLVVEDDVVARRAVRRQLADPAFVVTEADDGEVALQMLNAHSVDVVLADVMMPRLSGMELLRRVRELGLDVEVIMMTAYNDLSVAFEAVQAGAFHFLKKPFTTEELRLHVLRASERRHMVAHTRQLVAELDGARGAVRTIGNSRAMRDVRDFVARVGPQQTTVLITGECGTGKEVVARSIHAQSPRANKRFIAVNCGALAEGIIESELFGSSRGAFTGAVDRAGLFEVANEGTIFLDEIGELPRAQQVRLLRVLQERKVTRVGETSERAIDVRVIAATNLDIEAAVAADRFRRDLFFRLAVQTIELPPLRMRREDVHALALHFVQKHGAEHNPGVTRVSPMALRALEAYDWPGNVRELENAVVTGLGNAHRDTLELDDLPRAVRASAAKATPPSTTGAPTPGTADAVLDYTTAKRKCLEDFERSYFTRIMETTQRNVSHAARLAGLDRSNFRRILRRALGENYRGAPCDDDTD
jgi:two-component system response regulator HydG